MIYIRLRVRVITHSLIHFQRIIYIKEEINHKNIDELYKKVLPTLFQKKH